MGKPSFGPYPPIGRVLRWANLVSVLLPTGYVGFDNTPLVVSLRPSFLSYLYHPFNLYDLKSVYGPEYVEGRHCVYCLKCVY